MSQDPQNDPAFRDEGEGQRSAFGETEDKHRLLQTSKFINANVPWIMFCRNTAGWFFHVAWMGLSSYVFLDTSSFSYEAMTPKCYDYVVPRQLHLKTACMACGLCFWTFPLGCAMVALIAFAKNFFHARLYYEAVLHRIMLMYRNDTVLKSGLTWFLAIYGTLALCDGFFLTRGQLAKAFIAMYALYVAPIVSMVLLFTSQWEVEAHIIPLPKYYETDPERARAVLAESAFTPVAHLRIAFEQLEETLESGTVLSSVEYFGRLAEGAERESAETTGLSCSLDVARTDAVRWYDPMLAKLDMMQVDQHPLLTVPVSRPELLTVWHDICKGGFWVSRLLHSSHLDDERSSTFRFWSRVYTVLVGLALLAIAEVYFAAVKDFLKYQRAL